MWSRAFRALVEDAIQADKDEAEKRHEENLDFLKSFLPNVRVNGKDAYELYRNRERFDSFGWAADTIGGWFD